MYWRPCPKKGTLEVQMLTLHARRPCLVVRCGGGRASMVGCAARPSAPAGATHLRRAASAYALAPPSLGGPAPLRPASGRTSPAWAAAPGRLRSAPPRQRPSASALAAELAAAPVNEPRRTPLRPAAPAHGTELQAHARPPSPLGEQRTPTRTSTVEARTMCDHFMNEI